MMDQKTLDALAVLDLKPGVTFDEVKKAYRELALIWHPDKVPNQVKDRATRKFAQINEAYDWITEHPDTLKQKDTHTGRLRARTQAGQGVTPSDPGLQRVVKATVGYQTSPVDGIYVYPDMDRDKLNQFLAGIQSKKPLAGLVRQAQDILVFYDIDGTGEVGMAITRSLRLINNNAMTAFDLDEVVQVKLEDALMYWSKLSVRRKDRAAFELAGYASRKAGQILSGILQNLLKD